MVSSPALPAPPALVPCGALGFVSGDWAVLFPLPPVLAGRDDDVGPACRDGGVAARCVIGSFSGYRADLFAYGALVQQVRQNRAVTIAPGVNSTARMSEVAVTKCRWTLRLGRRP